MTFCVGLAAAALLHSVAAAGNFCGTDAGCIYPYPTAAHQGEPVGTPPTLDPAQFATSCLPEGSDACHRTIIPALQRMAARIFIRNGTIQMSPSKVVALVVILESTAATDLQLGVDESYTLAVPEPSASMTVTIKAATEWGALHGMQSFAQAVQLTKGTAHNFFNTTVPAYLLELWPPAYIADSPRTAWRGLMVDTSRHFLSVPTITRTIEAMAMSKLNTLHWHIVDGDGWPLCINATRKVCEEQAYTDPFDGALAAYTADDLAYIVSFARARGVRVVPEFDLPGHIQGPFCAAEPQLCIPGCAPDPSSEPWWEYLGNVVSELGGIFTDDFFHGGGDEFRPDCWFESPPLKAWAAARNMTSAVQLLDYFQIRWQTMLLKAKKRPMFWDEFFWVYDAATPERSTLTVLPGTTASVRGITGDAGNLIKTEYSGDLSEWEQSLAAGIPSISTGISEMWYLDRVGKICSDQPGGVDPKVAGGSSYFWQTWRTYHDHDPFASLSNAVMANRSLMLGGEVDMWGEGIDDTNFEPHVFPSAAAAAERMWSHDPDPPGAAGRLSALRCMLVQAGIRAAPIGPGGLCGAILKHAKKRH